MENDDENQEDVYQPIIKKNGQNAPIVFKIVVDKYLHPRMDT